MENNKLISVRRLVMGIIVIFCLVFIFIIVDFSIKNNINTKTLTKLKNLNYSYQGNGTIKVKDFPLEPQKDQIQGTFKIKDMSDEVIMDMNLPNEAVPHGAQKRQKVGGWFPFDDISMPEDFNSINPWGQIFIIDGEDYPQDTEVYIRNLTLICYKKSSQRWEIMNIPNEIDGCFYKEDFADQSTQDADVEHKENGIVVHINNESRGRCFHFWTKPVEILDSSDIEYVTSYCDVSVSNKDSENKFVFNVGADYKKILEGGLQSQVHEVIGGRFKILTNETRRAYATNLAYDKYFELCNQEMIDNLTRDKQKE